MSAGLPIPELEAVYDLIATAIDRAGPQRELFLAKLALVLADQLAEVGRVESCIEVALHPRHPPPGPAMHPVVRVQRTRLLNQQGKKEGEKAHGRAS